MLFNLGCSSDALALSIQDAKVEPCGRYTRVRTNKRCRTPPIKIVAWQYYKKVKILGSAQLHRAPNPTALN